jgi:hypothetical protein
MWYERIFALFSSATYEGAASPPISTLTPPVSEPRESHPQRRKDVYSTSSAGEFIRGNREIELKSPSTLTRIRLSGPESIEGDSVAMDQADEPTYDELMESHGYDSGFLKQAFALSQNLLPDDLFNWYSAQSFIGYQACAIISQHWLVNKTLVVPAEDAVRNWFDIATDNDEEIEDEDIAKLIKLDKKYKLFKNLMEAEINRRRFGFRLVIYNVESEDKDYYRKPFNIDGVKQGSYKGMSQVDPSWISPLLNPEAAANPASMDFYEPTWWQISGTAYHKSHLEIIRYVQPPDILKPTYQYGGIPLVQLILERVYAAERTANEAPMLVQTKRLNVLHTDLAGVTANQKGFTERIQQWIGFRDNYGVNVVGHEDVVDQLDTTLNDLDEVIMTQYQLVAAVSGVPATKLLGTSPKGFNATGLYERENYHESLESIQKILTPIIDHHHKLVIKSEMGGALSKSEKPFEVVTVWNPVGSTTPKEQAEINLLHAQTALTYVQAGAITELEVRNQIISDPKSGFNSLESFEEEDEDDFNTNLEADPDLDDTLKGILQKSKISKAETLDIALDRAVLGYVYVSPEDETALALHVWATKAGIKGVVRPSDMHVTIANDSTGIKDYSPRIKDFVLKFTGDVMILGNALVLGVGSSDLYYRYRELEAMGAKSDFDSFIPHLTIKYNPDLGDLEKLQAAIEASPLEQIQMGRETRATA